MTFPKLSRKDIAFALLPEIGLIWRKLLEFPKLHVAVVVHVNPEVALPLWTMTPVIVRFPLIDIPGIGSPPESRLSSFVKLAFRRVFQFWVPKAGTFRPTFGVT
jgi:hypothetical protein